MRSLLALLTLVLAIAQPTQTPAAGKTLLLIGQGPDGHPPGTHEYRAGLRILARCLESEKIPGLKIEQVLADEPWADGPERLKTADGVVIFLSEGAKWSQADPRRADALAQLAARGGGIVGVHWGIGCKAAEPIPNFLKLLGGCHGGDDRKYAVVDTRLDVADKKHPITRGIRELDVHEELYYRLKFVAPAGSIHPILSAKIDGRDETVAWSWERPDGGRSFGFSGLHFHDNWRHRQYRMLISQAALWSLRIPIPDDGLDVDLPADALKLP